MNLKEFQEWWIFFSKPVSVREEQTENNRVEKDIVRDILNDEKIDFPTDTDHIGLPNTAEEIKQQSIDENKLYIETELRKKRKRLWNVRRLIW